MAKSQKSQSQPAVTKRKIASNVPKRAQYNKNEANKNGRSKVIDETLSDVNSEDPLQLSSNGNPVRAAKRRNVNSNAETPTASRSSTDNVGASPHDTPPKTRKWSESTASKASSSKVRKSFVKQKNISAKPNTKKAKRTSLEAEDDDEESEYEVADLVDHKMKNGASYYLVRWKGYSKNEDTWEPEESLSCADLILKFNKNRKLDKLTTTIKKGRAAKKEKGSDDTNSASDSEKEWEVKKIVDFVDGKNGRLYRIRWKGFKPKDDTWEKESNLNCPELIAEFMKSITDQDNVSVKELRENPCKTRRLVNETSPQLNGRKSKRSATKPRVFYGGADED